MAQQQDTWHGSFASWFVGWVLVILIFWALNRSRWGHTVLYGLLWGAIIIMVVTNSDAVIGLFADTGLLAPTTTQQTTGFQGFSGFTQ